MWHNEEADKLAERIQKIVKCWKQGAICPSEFLFQLDFEVSKSKVDKWNNPSPDDLSAKTRFMLHLVDTVWGVAHENESVPATDWAERMIIKAKETFKG